MMIHRFLVAATLATLAAAPAHAFISKNDLIVRPAGGAAFDVLGAPGLSASQSWCAAGDFVIDGLGLPTNTRIWRTSEPPRRQGQGVSFSLSPEGAASKTGLFILGSTDASLSAIHAQALCRKRLPFS